MAQLWSRNFTCMFLANLFLGISFYILMGIIPLFVTEDLKLSESYVGLIMGAFSIAAFSTRPLAGLFLDSFGRMKVFISAIILFILCCVSYLFAVSFVTLFIIRTIHGLGWGLTNTSGSTIAADVVPISRRAEGLGFYAMAMSIGMALGPAIGVTLLIAVPFNAVFALTIFLGVVALCIA